MCLPLIRPLGLVPPSVNTVTLPCLSYFIEKGDVEYVFVVSPGNVYYEGLDVGITAGVGGSFRDTVCGSNCAWDSRLINLLYLPYVGSH